MIAKPSESKYWVVSHIKSSLILELDMLKFEHLDCTSGDKEYAWIPFNSNFKACLKLKSKTRSEVGKYGYFYIEKMSYEGLNCLDMMIDQSFWN
jgi:hypothetical protein